MPIQLRPLPQSRADFARLTGRARSTISEATAPGGPLHAAMVGDRIDCAHPAAVRYRLGPRPTIAELAQAICVDADELAADSSTLAIYGTLVWFRFVTFEEFANRAGVTVDAVRQAVQDELARAMTPDGLDLGHAAALEFMARQPFEEDPPDGFLAPACVGESIDVQHPVARAYLSRLWGVAATDSEIDRRLAP